jgi:RND family efflux transporter MFP subunit
LEQQSVVGELSEQLAQLEFQIQEHTLRAPYDGSVGQRFVSVGTLVAPNVPILHLVESDALEVWFGLPADAVDELQLNETYKIQISGRALNARLHAKLPELDQSARTRTVVFSLDSTASLKVLPGDVARIEIQRRVEESGFWLPLTALTREARGLWSVYELVGGEDGDQIVARQYVEVMHLQGELARVRGTLEDGSLVIADGTHRVVPGQSVTVPGQSVTITEGTSTGVHGSASLVDDGEGLAVGSEP